MRERLLDRDYDDRRRLLTFDRKPAPNPRIGTDLGAAVDAVGLVGARDEENQPDARVLDDVLQAVQPIVAATIGDQQGAAVVRHLDETGLVALGRAIEPRFAARRQHQKRRGRDEGPPQRIDVVELLLQHALQGTRVMRRQFICGDHG